MFAFALPVPGLTRRAARKSAPVTNAELHLCQVIHSSWLQMLHIYIYIYTYTYIFMYVQPTAACLGGGGALWWHAVLCLQGSLNPSGTEADITRLVGQSKDR